MKPTDEQVKEFWERCGFTIKPLKDEEYLGDFYYYPDCNRIERYVDLTLNNIFLYAVPKLEYFDIYRVSDGAGQRLVHATIQAEVGDKPQSSIDKDPALALFWAIYKAFGGK